MTIEFGGITVHGTHGLAERQPRELLRRTAHFWALLGPLEIIGGRGSRMLAVEIMIHHNYATVNALETDLEAVEARLGQHGTLIVRPTGLAEQQFQQTTFIRFERLSLANRADTGPLYDYAGTVDGKWCQLAKLHFEQLYPGA